MPYRSTQDKRNDRAEARTLYVKKGLSLKEIHRQTGHTVKTLLKPWPFPTSSPAYGYWRSNRAGRVSRKASPDWITSRHPSSIRSFSSGIKQLSNQPFHVAGNAVFGQGGPDAPADAGKMLALFAGQAVGQAGRGLCRLG